MAHSRAPLATDGPFKFDDNLPHRIDRTLIWRWHALPEEKGRGNEQAFNFIDAATTAETAGLLPSTGYSAITALKPSFGSYQPTCRARTQSPILN